MSDVACICSAPIIAEARSRGFDVQSLIEGLGVPMDVLEDPSRRMPWNAFTEFAHRAAEMLGIPTLQDLAARATVEFAPRPIRMILPHLRDSRVLFTLAPRWWGPWVFRGSRGMCEALSDGRLREVVKILPEFRECPEFLEGLQGTLRGMPRLLGQSDALVSVDHDGREAEFIISPPPRRASWRRPSIEASDTAQGPRENEASVSRVWTGRQARARARAELEAIGFERERVLEGERTIHALSLELAQKTKSLGSLGRLGQVLLGAPPSDYASLRQSIAELVLEELAVEGVRLVPKGRRESAESDAVLAGAAAPSPSRVVDLRVGKRGVGRLELSGRLSDETVSRLEFMTPWIAFSLECGGSKSLTKHLLALLSEDLRDWDKMEERLEALHREKPNRDPLN